MVVRKDCQNKSSSSAFQKHSRYRGIADLNFQIRDFVEMPGLLVLFLHIFPVPLTVQSRESSDVCHFSRLAKNFLPTAARLAALNDVRSSVECASLCQTNFRPTCVSYAYSRALQECHVFSVEHDPNTVNAPKSGFVYYKGCSTPPVLGGACLVDSDCGPEPEVGCCDSACHCRVKFANTSLQGPCQPVPTGWVGDSCSLDGHCKGANTECRNAKCSCVTGYHFSPCAGTCVQACTAYGTGYYTIPDGYLDGNNDVSYADIDWDTCWQHCLAHPTCRTVDYWASWCHLSVSTKIEKESDWLVNPSLGISYNQRDCA